MSNTVQIPTADRSPPPRGTGLSLDIHPVTLEVVGGRALQEQFEEGVAEVAQAIQAASIDVAKGKIKGRVTVAIEFSLDAETGAAAIVAALTTKLPARRKVGAPAILRGGRFFIEPDDSDRQLVIDHHRPQE